MKSSFLPQSWWRIAMSLLTITLVLGLSLVYLFGATTAAKAAGIGGQSKVFSITFKGKRFSLLESGESGNSPPGDQFCRSHFGFPCYSPQEIRRAYGVDGLIQNGFIGTGQSIIIIDSFGSPTLTADLHAFDVAYGLPDPPSPPQEYALLGRKAFNPNDSTMVGWAFETTLDVEWAHAMAPGANIVLMTSPIAETQGVQGMPQFLYLERYALDNQLGKIISQSWGTTENTLFGPDAQQVLSNFNDFYQRAAQANVTVFASSGDSGVANPNTRGQIYRFPTVSFPASSPYVTAVGGTTLMASTQGDYQSETVWSGSGGGISQHFPEPDYQTQNLNDATKKLLNGFRGLPDISYNADPNTSILIYASFLPGNGGYFAIGGTSEGSPQWAGIMADANQLAGHPLGFINPSLYKIGSGANVGARLIDPSEGAQDAYHDVTTGNNSADGITGYNATTGWDLVTGWGSPKATTLVTEIIKMQPGAHIPQF